MPPVPDNLRRPIPLEVPERDDLDGCARLVKDPAAELDNPVFAYIDTVMVVTESADLEVVPWTLPRCGAISTASQSAAPGSRLRNSRL
jgi:hypothetical protein